MQEERAFLKAWCEETPLPGRTTARPIAVAVVGLVDDGKSTAARAFAKLLGAVVVEGDAIRTALRVRGMPLARARLIAEPWRTMWRPAAAVSLWFPILWMKKSAPRSWRVRRRRACRWYLYASCATPISPWGALLPMPARTSFSPAPLAFGKPPRRRGGKTARARAPHASPLPLECAGGRTIHPTQVPFCAPHPAHRFRRVRA